MLFDQFLKEKQFKLKMILWSFVLYLSVLYPFISKHNLVVIIMTVSLFAFAGYAQFKNVSISSLLRLLLLIGALFYIRQTFRTFRGLEPGIAFLSLLLGIKVLEMNKKRDFFIFILIVELFRAFFF